MKKTSLLGIVFLIVLTSSSFLSVNAEEIIWDKVEIQVRPSRGRKQTPVINPYSRGWVTVAILTSGGFDASTVSPESVMFAGVIADRWRLRDFDRDGDKDLILRFRIIKCKYLPTMPCEHEVLLVGWAFDTDHLYGTDSVRIVPRGRSS